MCVCVCQGRRHFYHSSPSLSLSLFGSGTYRDKSASKTRALSFSFADAVETFWLTPPRSSTENDDKARENKRKGKRIKSQYTTFPLLALPPLLPTHFIIRRSLLLFSVDRPGTHLLRTPQCFQDLPEQDCHLCWHTGLSQYRS